MTRSVRSIGLQLLALALLAGCLVVEAPTTEVMGSSTIVLQPASTRMVYFGQTTQFRATIRDPIGQFIRRPITWSSTDASVFTVDTLGLVTAVGNGSAELRVTAEGTTAVAPVTVEQTPANISVLSGSDQRAVAGMPLGEPIVVRVGDEGGNGMSGLTVTFTPAAGSGSVSSGSAQTDARGEASTRWTLGGGSFGTQSLGVAVGTIENRVNAFAVPETPIPDIRIEGALDLGRDEPTDLETVEITVVVANTGNAITPPTVPLTVFVDGSVVETLQIEQLEVEERGQVTFSIGPLEVGEHEVSVLLDPGDEIEEWYEDNNRASLEFAVAQQRLIELGQTASVASNTVDEMIHFRIDIAEGMQQALNFQLQGGNGDADLFVHFGDRPDTPFRYGCQSGGPATLEFCQMVPVRAGSYHIAVHAFSEFGPTDLRVTIVDGPNDPFDVDVRFMGTVSDSRQDVIRQAVERWESVIAQGADEVAFGNTTFPGNECIPGGRPISGDVDDLLVLVTIDELDGAGGAVASGQPCLVRSITFSRFGTPTLLETAIGGIVLDESDVNTLEADGMLAAVVSHNVGHVLGFGFQGPRLWGPKRLIADPLRSADAEADTHFTGPLAIDAFNAAGGLGYPGAKVPLENTGRPGVANEHWRKSVFGDELMTAVLTSDSPALSLITVESLADMGYGVDLTQADDYMLPIGSAAASASPWSPVVRLGEDLGRYPIRVIDRNGRFFKVGPAPGK